jgi:cell division transport system permease protein
MYFLRKAYRDIRRNLWVNGVSIGIIVFTLLIFSIFLLVLINLNKLLVHWEGKIQVISYLKDGISTNEVKHLEKHILDLREVRSIKYVSKSDSTILFKGFFGNQKGILEGLDLDILPASFEIQLKKEFYRGQRVNEFVKKLSRLKGITDIQYGQEWITRLSIIVHLLRWGQWIVGGILFLAISFIISNTIKLSIYSRKEEIEIMRLVGATDGFIKIPFLIEGFFQGVSGAILSVGLLFLFYQSFLLKSGPFMKAYLGPIVFSFLPWNSIGGVLLVGIFLGFLGSSLSLARFLKA